MKKFLCWFLLVSVLILSYGQLTASENQILSISDGFSFGFCRGYCRRSINITLISNELVALKEPNYEQEAFPPVTKTYPFSTSAWQELISSVSATDFQSLDDRIGCPDCADGGAEWIEVNWTDKTKRVTFENGESIKGFDGLVAQLRDLRNKYTKDL